MKTKASSKDYEFYPIRFRFLINGENWYFDSWEYEAEDFPEFETEMFKGLGITTQPETIVTFVGTVEGMKYTWRFDAGYVITQYENNSDLSTELFTEFTPKDVKYLVAPIIERRDWHFNWRMQWGMRYASGKGYILPSGIA